MKKIFTLDHIHVKIIIFTKFRQKIDNYNYQSKTSTVWCKRTWIVVIKILQGSAVTQNVLRLVKVYS